MNNRKTPNVPTYSSYRIITEATELIRTLAPCTICGGQPNVTHSVDDKIVIKCCGYKIKRKSITIAIQDWNSVLYTAWKINLNVRKKDLDENKKLMQIAINNAENTQ